jgi:uncharacterized membrane protein SpoIIM required for sporulation
MKEAAFVKQRVHKWQEFERLLEKGARPEPDALADLYIQLTDDLSFSRTQFPKSQTTQYLNGLTSRVHQEIYQNKREDSKRIWKFWKYELPVIMYEIRKPLLYAFLVFSVAIFIGWISSAKDPDFVRLILGDAYVNMTLENIENGNPLAVYGKMSEADMFFAITFNNVKVSFMAFVAGLLVSVGTGFLLFQNGVMVGSIMSFFAQKGLLGGSFLIIMLHGTLELSAIVIAGAAGFVMGNSILFPGTYSRLESFKRGAKKGLKVVVGLIPVFILAGFIEGFFTRHTTMHWSIKLSVILLSATFIIYYFIIYPIIIHRNEQVHRTASDPVI